MNQTENACNLNGTVS